ncbi:Sialic acid O-acyltransferase, NeuD [Syntrophomonas zehnderi OL-4]|uniref:Sialic acid O-acyltransferase, NeuD n=1 Tax=Syntrophomonas zehnderi OL-4 TaxID=690567 RepID=A0A0E4GCD0_9FIRM|nr:acetyltransferase [Syntrophomonas zehnderi]CFX11709.1 Sialic acid O-acyltransferase, NeuD [Syntrophomonas zehnderi OL-4]
MVHDLKPLIIVGAGGLGREVAWLAADINRQKPEWDFIGFVDDGVQGNTVEGYPIIGPVEHLFNMPSDIWTVVAIADSRVRMKLVRQIQEQGRKMATLVHPSVSMSDYVKIEAGSIICSGTVITTNVSLGLAAIINPGCFIGHDTGLQDFVSLMPGTNLAGEVRVGEGCYFGLNSCVINRTTIGEWSVIGAGATAVDDIPAYSLAVGVPARVVKKLRSEV